MTYTCHTSHVTRHTSHVTRFTFHVTSFTSHFNHALSRVIRGAWPDEPLIPAARLHSHVARATCAAEPNRCKVCDTRHTSHVTRHTSHVTRHTSHVTCHTSHLTRHSSHLFPTCSRPIPPQAIRRPASRCRGILLRGACLCCHHSGGRGRGRRAELAGTGGS